MVKIKHVFEILSLRATSIKIFYFHRIILILLALFLMVITKCFSLRDAWCYFQNVHTKVVPQQTGTTSQQIYYGFQKVIKVICPLYKVLKPCFHLFQLNVEVKYLEIICSFLSVTQESKFRCDEMDPITYADRQINRRKPLMTLVAFCSQVNFRKLFLCSQTFNP